MESQVIPMIQDVMGQTLRELRDLTAHSKPERLSGDVTHAEGTEPPFPKSSFRAKFTPKDRVVTAIHDVEQFIESLHCLARPKVNDIRFGREALRGPDEYSSGTTTLLSA
jgi:hypothetical protein